MLLRAYVSTTVIFSCVKNNNKPQICLLQHASIANKLNLNKFLCFADETANLDNFQIVEEQEGIITVSAANMAKSEDELQFIRNLKQANQVFVLIVFS